MNQSAATPSAPLAHHHISIDTAVFGWDGDKLKILLVRRRGEDENGEFNDLKLPGSLIYRDEDLDQAARRALAEHTGLKDLRLTQFKAYGSLGRTSSPRDVHWLERAQQAHVDRIVTIAYCGLVKLDAKLAKTVSTHSAEWVSVDNVGTLAFDHNQIIADALSAIRHTCESHRDRLFELLPKKFTALQLRRLNEVIYGQKLDVRNFHKKITQMPYVMPLDEREQGVAHRAARYYKFDRKTYNTLR